MIQTTKLELKALAIAIIMMIAAIFVPVLATAGTVSAAGPYVNCGGGVTGTCPVFSTPSPSTHFFDIGNNAPVGMICWKDTVWHTVNYSSNRWFKVNNPIFGTQWVHSSEVYDQISTPLCP